jgi:hypothetical protein
MVAKVAISIPAADRTPSREAVTHRRRSPFRFGYDERATGELAQSL